MAILDATEYQFTSEGRQVLVRGAADEIGILAVGERYMEEVEDLLGATNVAMRPPMKTVSGAWAVVVTGLLPSVVEPREVPAEGELGEMDSIVRTAFLRFDDGPLVELTLQAGAKDQGAEAEFDYLLQTAQPSGQGDPVQWVAKAIEAGPIGRPGYPAGPILLELDGSYRASEAFALASSDGSVRYRLEATPTWAEEEEGVRSPQEGTIVGEFLKVQVGLARDEGGRVIRYETGIPLKIYRDEDTLKWNQDTVTGFSVESPNLTSPRWALCRSKVLCWERRYTCGSRGR